MITLEEYERDREGLQRFSTSVRRTIAWVIASSFLGYAAAGYVWWQGYTLWGLAVATISYLAFRMYRRIALVLARRVLGGEERTLALVERELRGTAGLEGLLGEIQALEGRRVGGGDAG
jgi:hypothetical protein